MADNPLQQLAALGQSVWYDNLSRDLLRRGQLRRLIGLGVLGVTVNPTIFERAVAQGDSYDEEIRELALQGHSTEEIYDQLIASDVCQACDELGATYRESGGRDGLVSLEVSPELARDTRNTVAAAGRYWMAVNRPNLLIKIPATAEGVAAIEETLFQGINVNVTLIFAVARYRQVMEAYCRGLERRLEAGLGVESVRSVASFFVSRVDTETDRRLDQLAVGAEPSRRAELEAARGRAAIANAAVAYQAFQEVFHGGRFQALAAAGAEVQRPLWASTSTKNPAYRDVLYCEELVAPETVNTMPPSSIEAFLDHGRARPTLEGHVANAPRVMARLGRLGVDLDEVTDVLEQQGVESFADSMAQLLAEIADKRASFAGQGLVASPRTQVSSTVIAAQVEVGAAGQAIAGAADRLLQLRAAARLHDGDPTLWPGDETDRQTISQSLGWLDEPHRQRGGVAALHRHAAWVRDRGFRHAVLVGPGGASIAATVFQRTFGQRPGFPELMVVDSTDPDQVAAVMARIDPARSLLLLASQGGARVEDSALWDIFLKRWRNALGEAAGEHCLAITAPGSRLEELAHELRFHVWPVSPGAGGTYGALSDYGLVPATTVGVDIDQLLAGAVSMADACFSEASTRGESGPGLELAAALAGCAAASRDKATILTHSTLGAVPLWLAPLLAQSTVKSGTGLVPVIGEPRAEPRDYGDDRLFIYLELEGAEADPDTEDWLAEVAAAGHPVVRVPTAHPLDLGAEFYRWEVATALAAALLGVDPFGLPEVAERAKRISDLLTTWEKDRRVPEPGVDLIDGCIRVAGAPGADSLAHALRHWLQGMEPPAHIGVVAYLPERPDHPEDQALVRRLREGLLRASGCATTFGYGSSGVEFNGQLRQGGASLQITGAHRGDLAIPGRPYPLGILQQAEAVADYRALAGSGRRVLRVHCDEVGRGLGQLARAVEDLLVPVGN